MSLLTAPPPDLTAHQLVGKKHRLVDFGQIWPQKCVSRHVAKRHAMWHQKSRKGK